MERMAEVVTDTNDQELQHFITNSPWDAKAIMNQIACDVDNAIANSTDSVCAPSEAWCFLQGESPCRVRFSQPPVSSVA